MPVRYSLAVLSDLFSKFFAKQNEWILKAKQTFSTALKNYCSKTGCRSVTPQKNLPTKIFSVVTHSSPTYGGSGGSYFSYVKREPNWHVYKVYVKSGR